MVCFSEIFVTFRCYSHLSFNTLALTAVVDLEVFFNIMWLAEELEEELLSLL